MKILTTLSHIMLLATFTLAMGCLQELSSMNQSEKDLALEQEEPECPICYELYNSDDRKCLVTKCNHKLCLSCTKEFAKRNQVKINCPLCRHEIPIDELKKMINPRTRGLLGLLISQLPWPINCCFCGLEEKGD